MKITRIEVYLKDLPYVGGSYVWGRGNSITIAKSTVVVLHTDAGLIGSGEFCPCGENYMEAHSTGVAAAAKLLAPVLLGEDPRQVGVIERIMDRTIQGHGYAKAPFDAACWDLLGQATQQPVWMLLGGRTMVGAPMYRVAPQKSTDETIAELEQYRRQNYRHFQIKVGSDWKNDIERIQRTIPLLKSNETAYADANQGWRVDEALRFAKATQHLDFILEQPCYSYEECLAVKRKINLPLKLDECITDFRSVQRLIRDRGAEIVCIKISKQGGLSKSRRMRDLLVDNQFAVVIEDTWGGEITTAAVSHLAVSTPVEFLINSTDLHNYNTERTGTPSPPTKNGKLLSRDAPGLGVKPDYASLGSPIAVYQL